MKILAIESSCDETSMSIIEDGSIDLNQMEQKINEESVVSHVRVKLAVTKNNAGMIGAGLLALE